MALVHRSRLSAWWARQYGCSYPITYVFDLPNPAPETLTAQVAYTHEGEWTAIPERERSEMFNGVNAARFDLGDSKAYVSVAFGGTNNSVYLRIVDGDNTLIPIVFDGVAIYYDARRCPVAMTWDDWAGGDTHEPFVRCVEAHQERGLWISTGMNPGGLVQLQANNPGANAPLTSSQWAEIQQLVDVGYLEPLLHGRTHERPSHGTYIASNEIAAGVDDIVGNLTLPPQSRRGDNQYVSGYIEPFGETSSAADDLLPVNGIHSRRRTTAAGPSAAFRDFDGKLFDRQTRRTLYDDTLGSGQDASGVNDLFDASYTNRGIFIGFGHPYLDGTYSWHPGNFDWDDPEAAVFDHLDHISGHEDVWYVGFGHLYAYRLAAIMVDVSPVSPTRPRRASTLLRGQPSSVKVA